MLCLLRGIQISYYIGGQIEILSISFLYSVSCIFGFRQ